MKINLIYTAALAAAFGGLMAAGGIDAAVTLGGMLGYAALALGMWGAALLLIGWGSYLEQEEARVLRRLLLRGITAGGTGRPCAAQRLEGD